jgi:hypothetical protein
MRSTQIHRGLQCRSLWSLEAAHANAADGFVCWLACADTLNDLFLRGPDVTGISLSLANSVTAIFNKCYGEFFTKDMLREKLALLLKDTIAPPFKDLLRAQVVDDLRTQLEANWRNKWPFNQQVSKRQ